VPGTRNILKTGKESNSMSESNRKIEGFKKVTLLLEAGIQEKIMDLTPEPVSFELVVGVGPEGYTTFEYELLDKKVGDILHFEIQGWRFDEMFGRLAVPLPEKVRRMDVFFMKVTVYSIEDADQTEIVRAMAGRVGDCGGGGGCCGNH
jgi:hypothetical protein